MTQAIKLDQWIDQKAYLRSKGYSWLPVLPHGSSTLDVLIAMAASEAKNTSNPYDPYRVELLFADISRLLDRIFSYRKEGYDLDISATTWAMDYELFKSQLADQIAIEQMAYIGEQKEIEGNAQKRAADAFGSVDDPLAEGFKQAAIGSSSSSDVVVAGERERRDRVQAKWSRLSKHQDELQARHLMPGGSLNFADRLDRLVKLLTEDVFECYQKAVAAALGLSAVYGINELLPDPKEDCFLDLLLSWTRNVLRQLEMTQRDDVDFEHVIPLKSIMGGAYDAQLGGGTIKVDLTTYFDPLFGQLWIRGVALSLGIKNPGDPYQAVFRATGQVFPPPTADLYDPKNYSARPPAILAAIFMDEPSAIPRMYKGANINNLNPRGMWTVIINDTFSAADDVGHPRDPKKLLDIRLHLLLSGRPEKSPANWHPLRF
ncbi:hypothetical protein [Rhizobium sp. CNPSo 3490]|uniref:hypothetical protein n=1 Tax=Rhizobium sp. CNPSo 3490 TaxID=3021407 RepID=UPI00254DD759|nr:hypothetical protein [Rhizobium sp. CNPSo 3490]MDK4733531.1 hypothetical protein [Rhizobium sp. CNPSo 3490]